MLDDEAKNDDGGKDSSMMVKFAKEVAPKMLVATSIGSILGGSAQPTFYPFPNPSMYFPNLSSASSGYIAGGMALLTPYCFTAGLATSLFSTAFFSTNFLLKSVRQQDDFINCAVSGSINASWMVSAECRQMYSIEMVRNLLQRGFRWQVS